MGANGSPATTFAATSVTGAIMVDGTIRDSDALDVGTLGNLTVDGAGVVPVQGDIHVTNNYSGTLVIDQGFSGELDCDGSVSGSISITGVNTGLVNVDGNVSGTISIGSNLNEPGRIVIDGYVSQADDEVPAIRVGGGVVGSTAEDPPIVIGGELDGVLAIDGKLENVAPSAVEIQVADLETEHLGAIAIDYDGWEDADDWDSNAVIKVDTDEYTENTPAARVYRISKCKGDLDNDRGLDSIDQDAMELTTEEYAADYPGLLESHDYHANVDNDEDVDGDDAAALDWLINEGCVYCMMGGQLATCNADIVEDGTVDLADLAQLLAHYGTTTGATRNDGDLDDDGDVDLSDLAELLSKYGGLCGCFDAAGGGGPDGGEESTVVTVTVEAYDTGGYKGGGFNGEVEHFVFDLKIEVDDARDDWLVTGAVLDASNDATLRLSTTATTPDQYATFVAAPWTSLPGSATAAVAGAYDPPDPNEVFTTTDLNLGWYDTAQSNDGPATVMRIVLDVSEVDGADVSQGFGSVYFSTTGPAQQGDILVADLASGTSTAYLAPYLKSYSGEFYVNGE